MNKLTLVSYPKDGRLETTAFGEIVLGNVRKFLQIFNTYYFDIFIREDYDLDVAETNIINQYTIEISSSSGVESFITILFDEGLDGNDYTKFIKHIETYDFHNTIPFFYLKIEAGDEDYESN